MKRVEIPIQGLGRLEFLYSRLEKLNNNARDYCLVIFAGDNGVSCENTSIYEPMSSYGIVKRHLEGNAPTAILLNRLGKKEYIVDVGLARQMENSAIIDHNIRRGSANFLDEDALEKWEVKKAIAAGQRIWDEIDYSRFDIIGLGEIGVANTLCAAALTAVMTANAPAVMAGKGSGDDKVIDKKADIISRALEFRYPEADNLLDLMARFGGLEIAALSGFILEAAKKQKPIVLDGFVTAVAALLASRIDSSVNTYLIAPSLSDERGHRTVLDILGLEPVFDLNINYGEGLAAAIGLFMAEITAKFHD
jgi:nicotinate-nucleotide--dimethylbenzimidazole phosphoribosyltransferase